MMTTHGIKNPNIIRNFFGDLPFRLKEPILKPLSRDVF